MMKDMQDEDIRIASDTPSRELRIPSDLGESVAKEFTRHKENGNIFLANRLGEELARPLNEHDRELFGFADERNSRHVYFLYGFAVRRAILDGIDVTILADTALHSFQETVEHVSEDVYAALNDSVSDTVYRLCLSDEESVGSAFSRLAGQDGDEESEQFGQELYTSYLHYASKRVAKVSFKP